MFTGIVEGTGQAAQLRRSALGAAKLEVRVPRAMASLKKGSSLAVNGVCLTVTGRGRNGFAFDLAPETLKRSALGRLKTGERVNLERALKAGARLEGHLVQGHVDGVGSILEIKVRGKNRSFRVAYPKALARYWVEKGSAALDGVSLTLGKVDGRAFWVHCIPHTLRTTTLGEWKRGQKVNLEADILAKLVISLTSSRRKAKL